MDNINHEVTSDYDESETLEKISRIDRQIKTASENLDLDKWDPMREDYCEPTNSIKRDQEHPLAAMVSKAYDSSKPSALGDVQICEHFARYGNCCDGKFCSRLHVKPEVRSKLATIHDTYQRNKDKTLLTHEFLSPIELKPDHNTMILISLSNVKSPFNFHFVAPYESKNFTDLNDEERDFYINNVQSKSNCIIKLKRIHSQLDALFNHDYFTENIDDVITTAQIVACKIKDGRFFRALVIRVDWEEDEYHVFLIDVGAEMIVNRLQIYSITANMLSEPPMALHGKIALIRPKPEGSFWSQEALDWFKTRVRDTRYFFAKIHAIDADDHVAVELFDINTRRSLNDELVSENYAIKF